MTLRNKRIVIIGGSSGIGLATAKAAVKVGGEVVIASRSKEKLQKAVAEIGKNATAKSLDVCDEKAIERFFAEVGSFDHLVTPGSATFPGSCLALESAKARQSFDSKFWGQYFAAKYGAPHIRQGGSIVLFSGVLSARPMQGTAIIASVNAAVEGLGRALSLELAPIRVNVVSPGYTDTPIFAAMSESDRKAMMENIGKQLPVGRVGKPEEVAQAVLYLLSSGFSTGTTLYIDGGYAMR